MRRSVFSPGTQATKPDSGRKCGRQRSLLLPARWAFGVARARPCGEGGGAAAKLIAHDSIELAHGVETAFNARVNGLCGGDKRVRAEVLAVDGGLKFVYVRL